MTLYRKCLDCSNLRFTQDVCKTCAGNRYVKVEPTDRICDEHDASVDINDKPYCTQGIILDETTMCVLSDVVRVPKEDKDASGS